MTYLVCPFISRTQFFDINGAVEGTMIPDGGFITMYGKCCKGRCMAWRIRQKSDDGYCILIEPNLQTNHSEKKIGLEVYAELNQRISELEQRLENE